MRLAPGTRLAAPGPSEGSELLVVSGSLREGEEHHGEGTWLRYPPGAVRDLRTEDGCTLYLKSGHL